MILHCIECDALVSGVEDRNADGFVRCPVHQRRLYLKYGADCSGDPIPHVGTKAKRWAGWRDRMSTSIGGHVVARIIREDFKGTAPAGSWIYSRARAAVVDVERRQPAATCLFCGARMAPDDDPGECGHPEGQGGAAAVTDAQAFTVKALDIFGEVHDTFQTEGELNGWRATQGRLV